MEHLYLIAVRYFVFTHIPLLFSYAFWNVQANKSHGPSSPSSSVCDYLVEVPEVVGTFTQAQQITYKIIRLYKGYSFRTWHLREKRENENEYCLTHVSNSRIPRRKIYYGGKYGGSGIPPIRILLLP